MLAGLGDLEDGLELENSLKILGGLVDVRRLAKPLRSKFGHGSSINAGEQSLRCQMVRGLEYHHLSHGKKKPWLLRVYMG